MKQLKRIIDYVGRDTENNPYIKIYYDFDNGIIKRSEQLDFRETNLASSFTRNSFPIFHIKGLVFVDAITKRELTDSHISYNKEFIISGSRCNTESVVNCYLTVLNGITNSSNEIDLIITDGKRFCNFSSFDCKRSRNSDNSEVLLAINDFIDNNKKSKHGYIR